MTITQPPRSPQNDFPRYSTRPFPSYRFVPGLNPHPTESPQGHSYGKFSTDKSQPLTPRSWTNHEIYLYGIDLYNYAYWWEAHEAWESIWQTADEVLTRHFLQGLIRVSAAFLKWHGEQTRGVVIHYEAARKDLEFVLNQEKIYCGLNVVQFLKNLDRHFSWIKKIQHDIPDSINGYPFIRLILKADQV